MKISFGSLNTDVAMVTCRANPVDGGATATFSMPGLAVKSESERSVSLERQHERHGTPR
jgi:hypothetical protein